MNIPWWEMTSNQHAHMQHVETKHWQSSIASWSTPNEETPERNKISRAIRTLFGKDCEVENVMKFLKDIGIFEEIWK